MQSFNQNFWKMAAGFLAIIALALISIRLLDSNSALTAAIKSLYSN